MTLSTTNDLPLTFVRLAHYPGGRVTDSEVQDLSRVHHGIERLHKLRNARGKIPPMDVQHIDVVGLELLQRCLKRDAERLCAVSSIVGL